MKFNTLQDLLVHQLQDLHSAEEQLTKAMPKMIQATSCPKLKAAIEAHLAETHQHMERLSDLLASMDQTPGRVKCAAMAGIIKEADETLKTDAPGEIKDAAIIASAQRVEHYEIAGYGTVSALAAQLGHDKLAQALERILSQEYGADEKLSELAEGINEAAAQIGHESAGGNRLRR